MNNIVDIPWGQEKITTTTRREHSLGTLGMTPDGRKFRWAFSDGALGAGTLLQQKAPNADHDMDQVIQAAAAVGAQTISITLGAAAATLDQYEDGWIQINDGAGEGHLYRIRSNPVAASGATMVVTLRQGDDVREALTTATSLAGLMENEWKDVATHATTTVGQSAGVAPAEIPDNSYFWCQTGGIASVLVEGTLVIGETASPSTTTAGAVTPTNYGGTVESDIVGKVTSVVSVTTDYQYLKLVIE